MDRRFEPDLSHPVTVREAAGRADLKQFLKLPYRLYRGDPCWVPPLLAEQKKLLDPARNPFFRRNEAALFLAETAGRTAGRIAAIANQDHNAYWKERIGFFGFFETEPDPAVAGALLAAAEGWARARGLAALRGPASFSMNEVAGLLVEGFDSPPVLNMSYNPPGYEALIEGAGYARKKELYAWHLLMAPDFPERVVRVAERLRRRPDLVLRTLDRSRFDQEIEVLREIFNDAWSGNWGFVPMDREEFAFHAHEFRDLVLPELALVVEIGGRPVAFAIALPDYHEALLHMGGRLLSLGLFRLLWKRWRSAWSNMRVLLLGVRRTSFRLGLPALLYLELLLRARRLGYHGAELSWTLEDNHLINEAIRRLGARLYKRYRLYEKAL